MAGSPSAIPRAFAAAIADLLATPPAQADVRAAAEALHLGSEHGGALRASARVGALLGDRPSGSATRSPPGGSGLGSLSRRGRISKRKQRPDDPAPFAAQHAPRRAPRRGCPSPRCRSRAPRSPGRTIAGGRTIVGAGTEQQEFRRGSSASSGATSSAVRLAIGGGDQPSARSGVISSRAIDAVVDLEAAAPKSPR